MDAIAAAKGLEIGRRFPESENKLGLSIPAQALTYVHQVPTLQQQLHFLNWFHSLLGRNLDRDSHCRDSRHHYECLFQAAILLDCPTQASGAYLVICWGFDHVSFFQFREKQSLKQVPHFSNVKKAFPPKVLELRQLRYHVKTTHERRRPFSLVVLSQRRGQVTTSSVQR